MSTETKRGDKTKLPTFHQPAKKSESPKGSPKGSDDMQTVAGTQATEGKQAKRSSSSSDKMRIGKINLEDDKVKDTKSNQCSPTSPRKGEENNKHKKDKGQEATDKKGKDKAPQTDNQEATDKKGKDKGQQIDNQEATDNKKGKDDKEKNKNSPDREKDRRSSESDSETDSDSDTDSDSGSETGELSDEEGGKRNSTKSGSDKRGGGFFSMFKRGKASGVDDKNKPDKHTRHRQKERQKRKANKKHYVAGNFSELPSDIQKKIHAVKLPTEEIDANWETILAVLRFVTKDSYRVPDGPSSPHSEHTPYAGPELVKKARDAITVLTDKESKKKFKRMELSGKGGFGRVFQTRDAVTKKQIAIKRVPHCTKKQRQNNYCEVAFLMGCSNHPNIVNFYESYEINGEVWIVTEFLEGGTLDLAIKVHRFNEQHIAYVAREILKGVSYLHSQNYVHRDLKSANVMMSISGEIKIIDFGLCCDLHSGPRQQTLGSPYWMPPEMVLRIPHTTKADIWSYAICVCEMILGRPPFCHSRILSLWNACTGSTITAVENLFANKNKDKLLKTFSNDMLEFMRAALVTDADKRPTADELLKLPFLNKYQNPREGIDGILRTIFISSNLQLHGI
eukprot:TRINITY_DN467_c0_g1_i1.p1 TRINITY_DN467_c0_g1~~TRINITY_DN467_c0_g1_i1.p1  ORF type:complete len:621 (+),score=113.01 TRINITY_DN467_c0_g1_i1:46-1908(+)